MELKEVIGIRRSIGNFNEKDITNEVIDDILDCGRLAPLAKNSQPWFFVVVRKNVKDKIADLMIEWSNNTDLVEYKRKINHSSSDLLLPILLSKHRF